MKKTSILAKKAIKIFGRYFHARKNLYGLQKPAVPSLSIEVTNVCNCDCVFCANSVMQRKKQELPHVLYTKAVNSFIELGGENVNFNVTIGDPLLDKNLLEKAKYLQQFKQLKGNGFVTTLQWLHLHNIDDFFEAGFEWISVSTVLTGRERYAAFFGADMYEQMLNNLVFLLEESKRRRKLYVKIDIKPTGEKDEEVVAHKDYQLIKKLSGRDLDENVKKRSLYVDDWQGAVSLPSYLKKRPLLPRAKLPCPLLHNTLMVFSNGNIGACACRDYNADSELVLGNISDISLDQAWNGKKLQTIWDDWRSGKHVPKICKSCRHYYY